MQDSSFCICHHWFCGWIINLVISLYVKHQFQDYSEGCCTNYLATSLSLTPLAICAWHSWLHCCPLLQSLQTTITHNLLVYTCPTVVSPEVIYVWCQRKSFSTHTVARWFSCCGPTVWSSLPSLLSASPVTGRRLTAEDLYVAKLVLASSLSVPLIPLAGLSCAINS